MCECGSVLFPLDKKHNLTKLQEDKLSDLVSEWSNFPSEQINVIVALICILHILEENVVQNQQIDMRCGRANIIRNLTSYRKYTNNCPYNQRKYLYFLHYIIRGMSSSIEANEARLLPATKIAAYAILFQNNTSEPTPVCIMYRLLFDFYERLSKLCKSIQSEFNICKNNPDQATLRSSYEKLCQEITQLQLKLTELKNLSRHRRHLPELDKVN